MAGSPWGTIQHSESIVRGLRVVSTAGHGGLMVAPGFARQYLSEAARDRGIPYSSYLCYEEDCECEIVLFELYNNPDLREAAESDVKRYSDGRTVDENREILRASLSGWCADYLEAIGEPVYADRHRKYLHQRIAHRTQLASLITRVQATDTPDVLQAWTADGLSHLVMAQPPFEYKEYYSTRTGDRLWTEWTVPPLTFLSEVALYQGGTDV